MSATQSTWSITSDSTEQTHAIGRALGQLAHPGDLIGLIGELGAGKTQLVRGIAEGLGISPAAVASPTFVVMHEYPNPTGGPLLVHIDAYRLTGPDDLETIGWEPDGGEFARDAVVVVEWADRLGDAFENTGLLVKLEHVAANTRRLIVQPGVGWLDRVTPLSRIAMTASQTPRKPADGESKCPTCRVSVASNSEFFPFCSKRCKLVDLGAWLKGDYRISRPIEQRDLEDGQ